MPYVRRSYKSYRKTSFKRKPTFKTRRKSIKAVYKRNGFVKKGNARVATVVKLLQALRRKGGLIPVGPR